MVFEIGDDLNIREIEIDIKDLGSKRRISALFSIRKKLFITAGLYEHLREEIYEQRREIADLFRNYGGDQHNESAKIFESLTKPDDLLQHVPKDEDKSKQERVRHRPFAFHVYGPPLSEQEFNNMRSFINNQSRKMGSINHLDTLGLLHVLEETYDDRPIYITQPFDEKLCRKLVVITQMNYRLKERIFILEWDNDIPKPKPITEHPSFQRFSTALARKDEDMIRSLHDFIYWQPREGEMFNGRVNKAVDHGFFIEIIPGVEGLVHKSEVPNDLIDTLEEGNIVTVLATNVDKQSGHIRLSITKAKEMAVKKGLKPVFGMENLKLLTDGIEEGI